MFLKLPLVVSFSILFITIQYTVFRKSLRTLYVSYIILYYIILLLYYIILYYILYIILYIIYNLLC